MATALSSCMIRCQESAQTTLKSSLHCEKRIFVDHMCPSQKVFICFSSYSRFNGTKRWHALHNHTKLFSKTRTKKGDNDYYVVYNSSMTFQNFTEVCLWRNYAMDNHLQSSSSGTSSVDKPLVIYSLASQCNEKQLKLLDSYFSKLNDDVNEEHIYCAPTSDFETVSDSRENETDRTSRLQQRIDEVDGLKARMELGSLENYFNKLSDGMQTTETSSPPSAKDDSQSSLIRSNVITEDHYKKTTSTVNTHTNHMPSESMDDDTVPVAFKEKDFHDSYDETSDFFFINLLASVDIAVFLFEIASPIRSSDVEQLSLPLIYGAKINKLILGGEWWRMVTPMFLHSGFLHIVLGCWVLLTFGPQVCRGYGPFTFFLIYILGGITANLTSFLHTPELTVCGTSPAFAIIGAWLIYQVQNKDARAKEASENMFWRAVVATALSFFISNFEQVDEWSHLGAVLSGLVYGFLTCPTAHLDKAPSEDGQEGGIALVKQQADPCKSVAIFCLSIFILCSLFFVFEPGLDILELDDLL